MSILIENEERAVTLTRYACRFGEVLKRHHPLHCTCGCKGGRIGVPECWTVTLAGEAPFHSTQTPLKFGSEAAASDFVDQLMRDGAGPQIDGPLTWEHLQASPDRPHVVTLPGQPDARVQMSNDGRLLKVKLTTGTLWRISVLDARTLDVIAEGCGTSEPSVWQHVAHALRARGWVAIERGRPDRL